MRRARGGARVGNGGVGRGGGGGGEYREPEESCVCRVGTPEWVVPAAKCPWPERTASGPTGARKREHKMREGSAEPEAKI